MTRQSDDAFLDGRQLRRVKAEDRALARAEKKDRERDDAVRDLGQLCREGKTIYYVYPVGGKYRESVNPYDLV